MQILSYHDMLIKLQRVIIKFKENQHFPLLSLSLVSLLKAMEYTYRIAARISLKCMNNPPQWWDIIAYSFEKLF